MNYELFTESIEYKEAPSRSLLLFREVCRENGLQFSSLRQGCNDLDIRVSFKESSQNGIAVTIPKNILEGEYIARGYLDREIRSYTPEIIDWLNTQKDEEQSPYLTVLKITYSNPIHDHWHGDGMPEKFRNGQHTHEEMKEPLSRFKECIHSEEKDPACSAFAKAQTALTEYQNYINTQNLLQETPADHKLHKASVLKWKAYVNAYESLPEYQNLLAAQQRLSLFALLKKDTIGNSSINR